MKKLNWILSSINLLPLIYLEGTQKLFPFFSPNYSSFNIKNYIKIMETPILISETSIQPSTTTKKLQEWMQITTKPFTIYQ